MPVENDFTDRSKVIGRKIEELKQLHPSLSYIECTVVICEQMNIEIEMCKSVLPKTIKEKIEAEALEKNLLKYKINTLL